MGRVKDQVSDQSKTLLTQNKNLKKIYKKKKKNLKKKRSSDKIIERDSVEDQKLSNEKSKEFHQPLSQDAEAIRERKRIKQEKKFLRNLNVKTVYKKSLAAADYLDSFKNDRINWKFKKVYQVFLLTNFLNSDYIDEDHFTILLEYFENLQGNARKCAIDRAKFTLSISEDESLVSNQAIISEEPNNLSSHSIKIAKERASKVIKLLEQN